MKKTILCLCMTLMSIPVVAEDDFGIWSGISAEKKLNKKFSVEAGIGFRAEQKLKNAARWDVSLGAAYKPMKWLKLSAAYMYIHSFNPEEVKVNFNNDGEEKGYNIDHSFWRSRHRGYFEATGKVDVGRFTFSLRERYQLTHATSTTCDRTRLRDVAPGGYNKETISFNGQNYVVDEKTFGTDDKAAKNDHILRTRVKAEYNIKGLPLNPFVSYEFHNSLTEDFDIDKTRLIVGADWEISKKHKISLGYLYQNGANKPNSSNNLHAIDVGYSFEF